MKAIVEIFVIWGFALAVMLGLFSLNFWLMHCIEVFVGAKAAWWVFGASMLFSAVWMIGVGGNGK